MQRAFDVVGSLQSARGTHIARASAGASRSEAATTPLFCPSERLVQPRLATIGSVAMNDPIFSRLVDSRNRDSDLIGGALWRQADLFLQSAQVRLYTSIVRRSSKRLSSAFTG